MDKPLPPDLRMPEITPEDIRRAADIAHIKYTIEAIRHFHWMVARLPGTEAHKTVKFLKKLARQIPNYYHTYEQREAWNAKFPSHEEE